MITSRPSEGLDVINFESEHPGGIIGCEDKRAQMVVTLGQQYHVGAFFCGTVHLLMAITKLRRDAFSVQATGDFDGNLCISLSFVEVLVVVRAGVSIPQTERGITGCLKIVYRKMRKFWQPPRHLAWAKFCC